MTDDNDELAYQAEALMNWLQSQEISPSDSVDLLAFTIAVIVQSKKGLRKNKKLQIANVIADQIKSVWRNNDA